MNFGDIPEEYSSLENSKIVILPVPFDATSTWGKGSDKGPEAIIEASANMELYDIETDTEVYKKGIFTAKSIKEKLSPNKMVEESCAEVKKYLEKDKFVVSIGGEHSISIGIINAFAEKFKKITVVQLDAHSDMRESYNQSKYNHACVMARAKEVANIVQIGIRSMDISEKKNIDPARIFFAENIRDNYDWVKKAIDITTEDVYLTIDLDVLDPSIMPSTGTPEPGGMQWYQVLNFVKELNKYRNIRGFDVVELCPNEQNKAPDFLAAKLIYKILSYKFADRC